ncbi:MAG: hypothetical protein FD176_164 [Rhodospirillaceae bacterium]|nr:MAG: hypothetical protein FD176_164 [Rhodospirillaceae bacterium]TNC98682.1 MAG: hypothetical protein FD119_153 [Stygiobacter sp.]
MVRNARDLRRGNSLPIHDERHLPGKTGRLIPHNPCVPCRSRKGASDDFQALVIAAADAIGVQDLPLKQRLHRLAERIGVGPSTAEQWAYRGVKPRSPLARRAAVDAMKAIISSGNQIQGDQE